MLLKLIFFILLITVSHGTNDKKNRKEFIATSEWQIVEQGMIHFFFQYILELIFLYTKIQVNIFLLAYTFVIILKQK